MAPELRRLTIGDEPAAWAAAGFAVDGGRTEIDGVTLLFLGDADRSGVVAWGLTEVEAGAIDGLPTEHVVTTGTDEERPEHPNGAVRIDHVVAASPDLGRTTDALARSGIEPRRTRDTDRGGSPLRQVFFRVGRPILELVGPPEPRGAGPASFWGLAVTVTDLDAAKELLGDRLSDPRDAVQAGRRIATLRHEPLGISVPVAFMSA